MNSFQFQIGSHNLLKSCSFERQATHVFFSDGVGLTSANCFTPGHSLFQGRIDKRWTIHDVVIFTGASSFSFSLGRPLSSHYLKSCPSAGVGERMERMMKQVAPSMLSFYIDWQILILSCYIIRSRAV